MNDQQRENLRILAIIHRGQQWQHTFDMSRFCQFTDESLGMDPVGDTVTSSVMYAVSHPCNTSACAVGTAAMQDIPAFKPRPGEDWDDYAARVFGTDTSTIEGDALFDWLFSGDWANNPKQNGPEHVADRIDYFLKEGIPESFLDHSECSEWDWSWERELKEVE